MIKNYLNFIYTSVIFCFFGYIKTAETSCYPASINFQEETVVLKDGSSVNKKLFSSVMQCLGVYVYARANVENNYLLKDNDLTVMSIVISQELYNIGVKNYDRAEVQKILNAATEYREKRLTIVDPTGVWQKGSCERNISEALAGIKLKGPSQSYFEHNLLTD
ncbi:MAG: hypothetical protein K2X90_04540 [Candidatus Babeliaceae bacterium]|nr:hypothetical protein [Candidatus Babeliaceae bacterium]